jgi:hypothetical protein
MECFGTSDFDENTRLITLSAIIISGLHCIRFEVHTAVSMKITVHWDIMLCNLIDRYQYIGGACCLKFYSDFFKMTAPICLLHVIRLQNTVICVDLVQNWVNMANLLAGSDVVN